jgi:hypothetical protein
LEALEDRAVPALLGIEGVVNTTPLNLSGTDQVATSDATSRSGLSVVAWMNKSTTTGWDIYAQMYKADHSKLGGEIHVATGPNDEVSPSVSMASNGNWVVAWTVLLPNGHKDVLAARYSASGARFGSTITVAASSSTLANAPKVACAGDGSFVIAYTRESTAPVNYDVLARMYKADGSFQKAITVAATKAVEKSPAVARGTGSNAGFSIAYQSGKSIDLNTYSTSGSLLHSYVIVNDGNPVANPAVARDDAGDTVVAWQEYIAFPDQGGVIVETLHDWSVNACKVSAAGVVGGVLHLAVGSGKVLSSDGTADSTDYTLPCVAMKPSTGAFVVGYEENSQIGFAGFSTLVHVTEVNSCAKVQGTYNVSMSQDYQDSTFNPYAALSINAQGNYLLSYSDIVVDPATVNWRLGKLS